MMIRRTFVKSLSALLLAPAIVKAENIMKVVQLPSKRIIVDVQKIISPNTFEPLLYIKYSDNTIDTVTLSLVQDMQAMGIPPPTVSNFTYVPLQMVGEQTFQPKIGFKTRYGMVMNPFAKRK